jgi:predicted Zn-dependent protease
MRALPGPLRSARPVGRGVGLLEYIRDLFWRAVLVAASLALCAGPAEAQRRSIAFIRDAEIESTIRDFSAPLFNAAGLDPAAIGVHLVNDRSLNAFVGNGLNMFINTGLLVRSENAGQVIGVIAHETGHIQGGHLAQMREQISQATVPMLLEMLATIGAAATSSRASNPNEWGGTRGAPGPSMTERMLLRYSRGMESQADQAAIALLERTGQSSRGLLEFLDIIADQELMQAGRQDPYVRSHPITRERVETVRDHVARSRFADAPLAPGFAERHARMRAKLIGFLEPDRVAINFRPADQSVAARYARAIAAYKRLDFAGSDAQFEALIREHPQDPYFLETRAQFLLEQGKPDAARTLYARAAALAPKEPLIIQALGSAELQAGATRDAIAVLERARALRATDPDTWRLLAQAYARDGQTGLADYAQAEHLSLIGKRPDAAHFADRAMRALPPGSPAWQRAQDIKETSSRRPRP